MNVHVLVITIDRGYGDVDTVVQGVFTDAQAAHDAGLAIIREKVGSYREHYDFSVDTHALQ